jgi:hypothetical protein
MIVVLAVPSSIESHHNEKLAARGEITGSAI